MEESYTCEICHKTVHNSNRIVHSLRCQRSSPSAQTLTDAHHNMSDFQQSGPVATAMSPPEAMQVENSTVNECVVSENDPFMECSRCTYHNEVASDICTMCGNSFNTAHFTEEVSPEHCAAVSSSSGRRVDSVTWRCESCSCMNAVSDSACFMCHNVRPPMQSYSDLLIDDTRDEGRGDMDLTDHYPNWNHQHHHQQREREHRDQDARLDDVSDFTNSMASSMMLGAGIGAGLAWLNRTDVSTGAMAGAGIGAISDVALREFSAAERERARRLQRERASAPTMENRSATGRFVPPRGASVISLMEDDEDEGNGDTSGETGTLPPFRRNINTIPVTNTGNSRSSNSYSNSNSNSRDSNRRMPPMNVEALLMQALVSSVAARERRGTAGVGVRRGAGGRGSWMDMAMGLDLDSLPYEALLERFPAPSRGVDAATLDSLPVRSYADHSSSSSSSAATDRATSISSSSALNTSSSPAPAAVGNDVARSCSICLEEYVGGDSVKTLPCLHCFHSSCVDQWLRDHHTCPVCKHSLT